MESKDLHSSIKYSQLFHACPWAKEIPYIQLPEAGASSRPGSATSDEVDGALKGYLHYENVRTHPSGLIKTSFQEATVVQNMSVIWLVEELTFEYILLAGVPPFLPFQISCINPPFKGTRHTCEAHPYMQEDMLFCAKCRGCDGGFPRGLSRMIY
ncbi:hypothetical protein U0070_020925 [Myodes glareolus]|uniref:Uncharacterized protein n=1 Tax=Myodes glareolus TaxID=447135 RepID=A0AAW0IIW3_MYOGA